MNLDEIAITEELKQEFKRQQTKKFRTTTKLLVVSDLLPPEEIAHLSPFTPVLVVADYENGCLDIEILEGNSNE